MLCASSPYTRSLLLARMVIRGEKLHLVICKCLLHKFIVYRRVINVNLSEGCSFINLCKWKFFLLASSIFLSFKEPLVFLYFSSNIPPPSLLAVFRAPSPFWSCLSFNLFMYFSGTEILGGAPSSFYLWSSSPITPLYNILLIVVPIHLYSTSV